MWPRREFICRAGGNHPGPGNPIPLLPPPDCPCLVLVTTWWVLGGLVPSVFASVSGLFEGCGFSGKEKTMRRGDDVGISVAGG